MQGRELRCKRACVLLSGGEIGKGRHTRNSAAQTMCKGCAAGVGMTLAGTTHKEDDSRTQSCRSAAHTVQPEVQIHPLRGDHHNSRAGFRLRERECCTHSRSSLTFPV